MLQSEGVTYTDNLDKAEVLNKHFASVFTHDNDSPAPHLGPSPYPDLPLFETSIEEVYTLLTQVDPFKATGPDGIPPNTGDTSTVYGMDAVRESFHLADCIRV